jgi:hypothetical protein
MAFTTEELIAERLRRQNAAVTSQQPTPAIGQPAAVGQPAVQQGVQNQQPAPFTTEQLVAERQRRQDVRDDQAISGAFNILKEPAPSPRFVTGAPGLQVPGQELGPRLTQQAQRKQQARQSLIDRGFSDQQIDLTMQTEKALDPVKIGRPIGGMAGALAATALAGRFIPGPFDDAAIMAGLIAAGGAGLGGVAGEQAQTAIQEQRLISGREALSAFANEALAELGGRTITRGAKLIASPFIKQTIPEAAALVDDFAKVGGSFSPTELDNRFSLNIAEGFSRGSFGAQKIFQEFEEKQGAAVLAYSDNIIEALGQGVARQSKEEIGQAFADGISRPGGRVFNMLDDLFDPLFKEVDDIAQQGAQRGFRQVRAGGPAVRGAGGRFQPARELQQITFKPTVSTAGLKKFAQKQLATDKRLNGQFLSPTGRSKLESIVGMKEKLTFSDMRTLRSSFLRDARKMARDVDQSQSIIKQLAGITDNAIFDPKAAEGLSPQALNLLKNTNRLYRQAQVGLETTFSEKLAKRLLKNPSNVVRELFPNNNPKQIGLLRKSLVEPISGKPSAEGKALWNQLRQAWLADAVSEATKEGVANPKTLNNIFRKMGDKGLKEMFPGGDHKKLQTVFAVAGKKPGAGMSLFSRGTQAIGLKKMYDSGKEGDVAGFTAGGVLALGPLAFAKLATNPKGVKLLTSGLNLKPGAKGLVPNAVRMIRLLRDINKKEQRAERNRELRRQNIAASRREKRRRRGLARPSL